MKYTLHLAPINGGAFHCLPAREIELEEDRIATDGSSCSVRFPWESHPYSVRLWVIGNEYGALGAVWADCEQDALDEIIDRGLGDAFLIDETDQASATEEEQEEWDRLGNAGEPCDLTNAWMQVVSFEPARDIELIVKLAEARGACVDTLAKV